MEILAQIRYERLQRIGVGAGMNSEVFQARDSQFNGDIAVKEIPKSKLGNNPPAYFKEAQALWAAAHPNVVEIQYACKTDDLICLAMPHYPQPSLKDRIAHGPMPVRQALRMAQEVLSGVASVHLAGFIHFDVKPSNVLFNDKGVALLADFGQAREVSASGTVKTPKGYAYSLPPETWNSQVGVPESDFYQFGVLMYRAVNGNPFFSAQRALIKDEPTLRWKVVRGKFPDRNAFMPHVPKRLRTVIRKALKTNPAERYRSTSELRDDLAAVRVPLDWNVASTTGEGLAWRAHRPPLADYLVELVPNGTKFEVQVWTDTATERRRKNPADLWADSLTRAAAYDHLKMVFEAL